MNLNALKTGIIHELPQQVAVNHPLIFDIRRFAIDDGPGIRTTVFFKGCPLSCIWCHNPESMKAEKEIAFYPELCILCGDCVAVCAEDAVDMEHPGRLIRSRCNACGLCAEVCPAKALKIMGKYYPVDILVEELLKYRIFYETSQGGVTFSGGEPALHMEYIGKVMKALKKNHIHIAIQTSGMFDFMKFSERLLPYIDLIFFDIKLFDPELHRKFTKTDNRRIIANFIRLMSCPDIEVIPRMPLVPGITATRENISAIARFLKEAGSRMCELMPYNPGGIAKRKAIGEEVPPGIPHVMMRIEKENKLRKLLQEILSGDQETPSFLLIE